MCAKSPEFTFLLIYDKHKYYSKDEGFLECFRTYQENKKYYKFNHNFVLMYPERIQPLDIDCIKIPFKERLNKTRYSNIIDGILEYKKHFKNTIILLEQDVRFLPTYITQIKNTLSFYKSSNIPDYILDTQISLSKKLNIDYKYTWYSAGAIIPYESNVIEKLNEEILKNEKIVLLYNKIDKYISFEEIFLNKILKDTFKIDNKYIINYNESPFKETFMIHKEE